MFTLSLALFCLCAATLAASPPQDNPDYIYDPLNSTSHGLIFSPSRVVLKVDCPGCPVYDRSWHAEATSLIFDFTLIDNKTPQPSILLNNDSLYPSSRQLGWSGFTDHTSRPVPWNTTFDAYIGHPSAFYTADLVGVVQPLAVNNTNYWNLTAVLFLTVAYGSSANNNTFENFEGNVSAVELFYRSKTFIVEWEDNSGSIVQETRQDWELVWWQIVPFSLLYNRTVTPYPPSVEIPEGLTFRLLGYVPQPEECSSECEDLRPALDNLLSWVHFLGAVVIIVIIVGAGGAVWWYFGEEIVKWKGWEEAKKWWDEKVWKRGEGEGGENAPLLAGEQNEDD